MHYAIDYFDIISDFIISPLFIAAILLLRHHAIIISLLFIIDLR
jgi:hypothetical protein